MHRAALLGLLLTATACGAPDLSAHDPTPMPEFEGTGFGKFIDDTISFSINPNLPEGTEVNMLRVEALPAEIEPLTTETGTIWPGPPAPIKSLRELQLESTPTIAPEPRLPTSQQLGDSPAYTPAQKAAPSSAPSAAGKPTVLTNADGSKTIIHPDGRVEFQSAPK